MSEKNQYVKQSIKAYVNDVFRQNTIIKIQTKKPIDITEKINIIFFLKITENHEIKT